MPEIIADTPGLLIVAYLGREVCRVTTYRDLERRLRSKRDRRHRSAYLSEFDVLRSIRDSARALRDPAEVVVTNHPKVRETGLPDLGSTGEIVCLCCAYDHKHSMDLLLKFVGRAYNGDLAVLTPTNEIQHSPFPLDRVVHPKEDAKNEET